jgi:hypothetical protein
MAELPRITGGRGQISNAPNIALPEVSFGGIETNIAYQQQASYQGQVSQVLDRMTQSTFGLASNMSERAGLQFSAENPLTQEQLSAMSKGDMSGVDLGTPLNVFNSAVRKARALEVSGHAEIESREALAVMLQKAELGEIDATQLRDQMAAMMNGYGESIAGIDPDASFKYRATMSAVGGRVLEKVAELDGQKRLVANTIKVQRSYTNMQKEISLASTTKMPIDPTTGQEMPADVYIDALKQNFLANASSLVGVSNAASYVANIDKDINTSKVNAIAQYLITDSQFSKDPNGMTRLARGDAGSSSNAYQSLLPEDQARVQAAYMTASANDYTLKKRNQEAGESGGKRQFTDLYIQYSFAQDPLVKNELLRQLLGHPSLSLEQAKDLVSPQPSSPEGEVIINNLLANGDIKSQDSIYGLGAQFGVGGKELAQIFNKFNTLYSPLNGTYVSKKFMQAANVPPGLVTIDPKSEYAKKIRGYEIEFEVAQKQAAEQGSAFDVKGFVDNLADRAIAARASSEVQGAKTQLSVYSTNVGTAITLDNFPALKYKVENGQEDRIKKSQLMIIENLLKTIEGVQ